MTRPSDGALATIEPPPAQARTQPQPGAAAVNAMFEANIGLAYAAIHRFSAFWAFMPHERYEELVQTALLATWRACQNYDPGRGVKLSSVVYRYVRNAILLTSRQWTVKPGGMMQFPTSGISCVLSIEDSIGEASSHNPDTIGDLLTDHRHDDPAQIAEERDLAEERARLARRMIEACTNLCPGERTALNAALDGLDRGQMTELMNTSWHSARTAYANGLAKLRGQVRTIDNGRLKA